MERETVQANSGKCSEHGMWGTEEGGVGNREADQSGGSM